MTKIYFSFINVYNRYKQSFFKKIFNSIFAMELKFKALLDIGRGTYSDNQIIVLMPRQKQGLILTGNLLVMEDRSLEILKVAAFSYVLKFLNLFLYFWTIPSFIVSKKENGFTLAKIMKRKWL